MERKFFKLETRLTGLFFLSPLNVKKKKFNESLKTKIKKENVKKKGFRNDVEENGKANSGRIAGIAHRQFISKRRWLSRLRVSGVWLVKKLFDRLVALVGRADSVVRGPRSTREHTNGRFPSLSVGSRIPLSFLVAHARPLRAVKKKQKKEVEEGAVEEAEGANEPEEVEEGGEDRTKLTVEMLACASIPHQTTGVHPG